MLFGSILLLIPSYLCGHWSFLNIYVKVQEAVNMHHYEPSQRLAWIIGIIIYVCFLCFWRLVCELLYRKDMGKDKGTVHSS